VFAQMPLVEFNGFPQCAQRVLYMPSNVGEVRLGAVVRHSRHRPYFSGLGIQRVDSIAQQAIAPRAYTD
jgi:hypothetical protein